MNTNFYSLWFDSTGNRTLIYRFSCRRSIHSTTDRLNLLLSLLHSLSCNKRVTHFRFSYLTIVVIGIMQVRPIQWNSVNKSTVSKSSRLLHPICLERNHFVHFRKRHLLKLPRIKSKTGCPEVDLLRKRLGARSVRADIL